MRVTNNTFSNSLLNQLNDLTSRQLKLQNQASTGQRVQNPEDDPLAMRRVIDLQAESQTLGQYQRNISRLQELSATSYDAMRNLKKICDRAGEIAVLANDLTSPEEMQIYATEITELIKQAAQIVNTKTRGDFLFSGTRMDQQPFLLSTDTAGRVTSVAYQGNANTVGMEISAGSLVDGFIPGVNATGTGAYGLVEDSRTGADFFDHLISLQNHLVAGDPASIHSIDQANLEKDEEHLLFQFGINGALQSQLESTSAMLRTRNMDLEKQTSQEADADLTETLIRLKDTQTAYEAALKGASAIMNFSLLDFLR